MKKLTDLLFPQKLSVNNQLGSKYASVACKETNYFT